MDSQETFPTLPRPTLFWAGPTSGASQGLYVSANAIVFPRINHTQPYYNDRFPDPWEWYFPSIMPGPASERYWTCLLPQEQQFDGLFEPLRAIDVEECEGANGTLLWRLDSKWVEEWTRLEFLIYRCFRAAAALAWYPLELKIGQDHCPLPSSYGFSRTFTKRKGAVYHVRKLRAMFMLWIVEIQFLSFAHSRGKNVWADKAFEAEAISLEEYNSVQASALCAGFSSTRRIGFIVDVRQRLSSTERENLLKVAKHFGLPVWIYYGVDGVRNPSALDPLGQQHWPGADAFQQLQGVAETDQGVKTLIQTPPSSQNPISPPSTHLQPASLQFGWSDSAQSVVPPAHDISQPAVNPTTGQRVNESFRDFFARMDERVEKAFANGTPEQIQLWTARRERHSSLELPTREGNPLVFFWDDKGVRTLLGRKHWREKFADSSKAQRRYNPVSNQWDICQFLDPDFEPEEEDYLDEVAQLEAESFFRREEARASEGEAASSSEPPCLPAHNSSPPVASSSRLDTPLTQAARMDIDIAANLRRPQLNVVSPSVSSSFGPPNHASPPPLPLPSLDISSSTTLSPPLPNPASQLHSSPHPLATSSSASSIAPNNSSRPELAGPNGLRKILVERYGLLRTPQAHEVPQTIQRHYTKLKVGVLSSVYAHWKEKIPNDYAEEMRVYTAYLLAKLTPPPFLVDTAPGYPRGWDVSHRFQVVGVTIAHESWYVVRPTLLPLHDVPYLVVTRDPLTVAQVLRDGSANSTYQIARMLLTNGMPFKTLRAYPYPRSLMWRPSRVPMFKDGIPIGLGVLKPDSDTFTVQNYLEYADRRERIVQSGYGRAAFLLGGIVWRLAVDSMPDHDSVLDGPSQFPTSADYTMVNGYGYVDDTLDGHELAIICGVYRVLVDEHKNAESHAKYMSWWPSASAWNGSGMDVGYWTPSNEAWFQDRRSKILAGTAQPKMASEWRRSLLYVIKHTEIMLSESRRLAASVIAP